jgi:hypothetical protein
MFEDYLRWYEEKIGHSQNEYRLVGVALGHVVLVAAARPTA